MGKNKTNKNMFFSLLLILLGVIFLLKNLGLLAGNIWSLIWPLVLILIGVYLIVKGRRHRALWMNIRRKLEQ